MVLGIVVVAILLIVTSWFLMSHLGSGVQGSDKVLRDAKNRVAEHDFWYKG
jgi:hypothetical protein